MIKIVLFYHNFNTLGHSEIVFNLTRVLKNYFNDRIEIIVIEIGDKETKIFPFQKYCKHYYLPLNVTKTKFLLKNNILEIKKIINKFKPDVFITETYPFVDSPGSFLYPHLLDYVKNKFHPKIICCSFYLNYRNSLSILLKKYYDEIFLIFPKKLSYGYKLYLNKNDSKKLGSIMMENNKRINFTGFFSSVTTPNQSNEDIKKKFKIGDRKLILVSRGGRTEYGKLIDYSIRIAKKNKDLFFVISAGPSTDKNVFRKYCQAAKKIDNILIRKVIYPDFGDLLRAADLCINMGGYNTVVKLLHFGKKAIIFPANNTEQIWNAFLLKKHILCEIITKQINCDLLAKKINRLLKIDEFVKDRPKNEWFLGLDNATKAISKYA